MSGNEEYRRDMREFRREASWTVRQWIPLFLGVIVLLVVIGWGLESAGIINMNIKRQVFEQTQSYVHGKNTYIERLRLQYETATGTERESLRRLILEEASTISPANLSASNQTFIGSLRHPNDFGGK